MRKGINYDTGFTPSGENSRPSFDPDDVRRDMQVIAGELGCVSVRITGADPARLTVAAEAAVAVGLEVWFAPFPCELDAKAMRAVFVDCAERAERLRRGGADVVLVLGCELSLFATGFIPGDSLDERTDALLAGRVDPEAARDQVNEFLRGAADEIRAYFGGRLTYASGSWEDIDWMPFDIVSVDAYRDQGNAASFAAGLADYLAIGKPVAITEFGCCTYRGAAARGGLGWTIIASVDGVRGLDGDYVRDEQEQATYLRELVECFVAGEVDTAFWFTYASWNLPHCPDQPRLDLDLAAYGLLRVTADGLEPKLAFREFAGAAWR